MQLKESGIPLTNPESKFHTNWNPVSEIQYLESGIRNPESRAWNPEIKNVPNIGRHYFTGRGGAGGQEPGRRKGGKGDLYDDGKRERNSKRKAFVFFLLLIIRSKKRTQQLPFNVLRGLNFICEKSQKTKIRTRDKKTALLPATLETFSSRLHHKSRMRWHNTSSRVSTVSVVSVSRLSR